MTLRGPLSTGGAGCSDCEHRCATRCATNHKQETKATTTTTTNQTPDVPLPAGTTVHGDFDQWGYEFRNIWGDDRRVDATDISLAPCAAQLPDGSIDTEGAVADSPPQIFIDEVRADGARCECLRVSVEGALNLAADLLKLADVIKGWIAAAAVPGPTLPQ